MKNQSFLKRLVFAFSGIKNTFLKETSFRIQTVFAIGAIGSLFVFKPSALWWALIPLTIACVLAAELFNTALENLMDRTHPEQHPMIGSAKDCAAGAVLIMSLASLFVFIAMLCSVYCS